MKLVHLAHATMAARGLEGKSHSKLWSIKGLVKVILIQSLIVGFIWKPFLLKRFFRPTQDWNGVELKKAVQNILVLIQLITFAVIQMRAFDYRVYSHMEIQHKPARNVRNLQTLDHNLILLNAYPPHLSFALSFQCCFGRSKAEEPIDEGYRSLLNHKDRHAFTALQALIHALEPTELRGSQTPI